MSDRLNTEKFRKIQIRDEEAIPLEGDMTEEEKLELTDRVLQRMRQDFREEETRDGREDSWKGMMARNWQRNLWRGAAAVAVLAMLVPVGAYAYGKIQHYFQASVKKEGYQVEMPIATSKEETDKVSVLEDMKPVRLEMANLPGYKKHESQLGETDQYGYWLYQGENYENLVDCSIIKVDQEMKKELIVKDVAEYQEVKVGGHNAVYAKCNNVVNSKYIEETFEQELYVFYDDLGYILRYYNTEGDRKSAKKELLDFAEKVRLETCPENQADSCINLTSYIKWREEEEKLVEERKAPSGKQVYSRSEVVEWDGAKYQVMDVTVTDSVKHLKKADSKCFRDKKKFFKIVDKNNKLISYQREKVQTGDGKNEPRLKVTERKDVQLKFVEMTLRIKNVSGNPKLIEMNHQLTFMKGKKDYQYTDGNYIRPDNVLAALRSDVEYGLVYFKERRSENWYFPGSILLENNETQIYHLGYLVDEDQVDQMYFRMPWGSAQELDKYIDIRQ